MIAPLLLEGCSDGASSPQDDASELGGSTGSVPACENYSQTLELICVESVKGLVLDELDAPVGDLPVTLCGPVCFRGVTDARGRFEIEVDRVIKPTEYSIQAHGSPDRSTFYYPLAPTAAGIHDAGTLRVLQLSDDGDNFVTKLDLDGEEPPAQSVGSGPVVLTLTKGTELRLTVGDALRGEEGAKFRQREIPAAEAGAYFDGEDFRIFALGPFEAEMSRDDQELPRVGLRVENTSEWERGTSVEVLALGSYLDPTWLPPSQFALIGVASVSEDGSMIQLLPEDCELGLRFITWLVLRPQIH